MAAGIDQYGLLVEPKIVYGLWSDDSIYQDRRKAPQLAAREYVKLLDKSDHSVPV